MTPTKKPSGQLDWYETAMPAQTVTSAMTTDRVSARPGRAVSDLAAAAGPIIRLNISSAPTTGTVMLVARAMTSRNASSILRAGTPRASATSGSTEDSISGRNMTAIAATDRAPNTRIGSTSAALTPNTSPNSSEYASWAYWLLQLTNRAPKPSIITNVSAVATSGRERRLSAAMPNAPASENTARPANGSSPSRLAPAAPAKAPLGMACAANVDPRSTAKNPVTPAITATAVAAIQVLIIRGPNMRAPRRGRARRGPPAGAGS